MVRQAGSEGHKSRFLQLTNVTKGRDKDDAAQDLSDQAPASHHIPVRPSSLPQPFLHTVLPCDIAHIPPCSYPTMKEAAHVT